MANGTAALALQPPTSAPADATDKPSEPIERAIGRVVADATEALGRAMADYDAGRRLTDANRALGGETIAKVVEIQLATLGEMPEFADVALAEGRRVLLERHAAGLRQQLGAAAIARTFDELCGHIIIVANQVTAIELAYRSN